MSEPQNLSYPDEKRSSQRSQSNTNWRDKTSAIVISKRVWRVYLCMLVNWICLFFSFFPLYSNVDSGRCWSVVVPSWRMPPQNGNLLLRFEELNSKINLLLRMVPIERSILMMHSDSWIFYLITSPLVPLRPLVGLRPPSNSFILPFHLTITLHLCLLLFRTQLQKAFSLYAGALSLWHSPPQ